MSAVGVLPIDLAEGARLSGLRVRLQNMGSVSGVVRDARGEPLGGADLALNQFRDQTGRQLRSEYVTRTTNAKGQYRFDLVDPGLFSEAEMEAEPEMALVAAVAVDFVDHGERTGLDFHVGADP